MPTLLALLCSAGLGVLAAQQTSGLLIAAAVTTAFIGSWAATIDRIRLDKTLALRRASYDGGASLPDSIAAVNNAFTEATRQMDELRDRLADQQAVYDEFFNEADPETRTERQHRRDWMLLGLGALVSVPVGILVNWIS